VTEPHHPSDKAPAIHEVDSIRILSDLHLGHPASKIRQAFQIEELLDGAEFVIFNGDTVEEFAARYMPTAKAVWSGIRQLLQARNIGWKRITGNHDPAISEDHKIELAGGRILVIHGDFLFDRVAPWSHGVAKARRELAELNAREPSGAAEDLDARLALTRKRCHIINRHVVQAGYGGRGKITALCHDLWPPTRPLRIFRSWRKAPRLAIDAMKRYRPEARIMVMGHTHRPFIFEEDGRVVVNTGAYFSMAARSVVDVSFKDQEAIVRQVQRNQERFLPGAECGRYSFGERG
jgi:predicted phosphodiesterase